MLPFDVRVGKLYMALQFHLHVAIVNIVDRSARHGDGGFSNIVDNDINYHVSNPSND